MDDRTVPEASNKKRKIYKVVGLTLGLLCVLQAVLNISLRLALYSLHAKKTEERDESKGKLNIFDQYTHQGWLYFNQSVYYISSVKKSWHDSRDDCLQRDADLIIVNSKEEQEFTVRFHKHFWIGLTDKEKEGIWKWVDGTLLGTSFWLPGEPNSYKNQNEDCGETKVYENEYSWNDQLCSSRNYWICEKTVAS